MSHAFSLAWYRFLARSPQVWPRFPREVTHAQALTPGGLGDTGRPLGSD